MALSSAKSWPLSALGLPSYRQRMVAICSRLTGSFVPNRPLPYPDTMPFSEAQATASAYQASAATSEKAAVPSAAGLPAARYRTVANMARLVAALGEKVALPVPLIRPLSRTYSTAPAYQASAATSENPVSSSAAQTVGTAVSSRAAANRDDTIRLHFFMSFLPFYSFSCWVIHSNMAG